LIDGFYVRIATRSRIKLWCDMGFALMFELLDRELDNSLFGLRDGLNAKWGLRELFA
jgi:hypothetical protein